MPTPTPELGLQQALDGDDTAAYLDTSLANSLVTIDALFSNVSGHTHGGVHQGGPIGSIPITAIPDGSITSAKITDGTIQAVDLGPGCVTTPAIAAGVTLTSPILNNANLNSPSSTNATISSPTISNPTITGAIAGNATFNPGPSTADWFHARTAGQALVDDTTGVGIGFDTGGPFVHGGYAGGHLITETATQTLINKILNSPTLNSPAMSNATITQLTLGGTVSGTPTWTAQAFPAGTTVAGLLAVASQSGTDFKVDGGSLFFNAIPTGTGAQNVVNFSAAFTIAPTVIATLRDSSSVLNQIHLLGVEVRSVGTSSFSAVVDNATGGNQSVTVDWMAFGH